MGKKHKKHKRHDSSRSPSAGRDDEFLRSVDSQSSEGGGGPMRVILKLSSSKQKFPKQHQPELLSHSGPLIVSISRFYLRPRTPTSVEEEMDTVTPSHSSSSFSKSVSKPHKPKKHKKHQKRSSHDATQPSFQEQISQEFAGSSSSSHSFQAMPQVRGRPNSGKQLSNIISEHAPASPFKFTFSKKMMEAEEEEEEDDDEVIPVQRSPTPPVYSHHEKKSHHTHKHKKHHRHSRHSHTSSMDSEEVIVNQSPSIPPSVSGKQMSSSSWLNVGEGESGSGGAKFSAQQSHGSILLSQESVQGSPVAGAQGGSRDTSRDLSHDLELSVVDEDTIQLSQLVETSSSKSHKKKKKKEKKKKKRSHEDREASPVLPLPALIPPVATPSPVSSAATPTTMQHRTPSPTFAAPSHFSTAHTQKAQEQSVKKRRRTSDDSIPTSPASKRVRHASPVPEQQPPALPHPPHAPDPPVVKQSPSVTRTLPPAEPSPLVVTKKSSPPPLTNSIPLFKTPTPPLKDVMKKPKKDYSVRVSDVASPLKIKQATPPSKPPGPSPPLQPHNISPPPTVKLSSSALKFFLKNIHHLIQKRDPEGIFTEPVTDDIAPGYSAIISNPMDLTTMATKVEAGVYTSVQEFKADFVLMCNNAMTYNAPETVYYGTAKRLLSSGLQIIAKETSVRPDMKHGRVHHTDNTSGGPAVPLAPSSLNPSPATQPEFPLPPPSTAAVDYDSAFLCSLPLHKLQSRVLAQTCSTAAAEAVGVVSVEQESAADQRHLTKVTVGADADEEEDSVSQDSGSSAEEILQQVEIAASLVKENLDSNKPGVKYCFTNQDPSGKTMLNILNPDTAQIDSSKPVDLSILHDRVRMGQNAATVLGTELPMMRATPVSYLMYGPFGSFAPVYDSAFATLTKMDSDLLLSSYGSELGVSYAHSLQNFVRGAGGFVSEMATAVLNGLTNNRHSTFMQKLSSFEEKEAKKSGVKSKKESSPSVGGGGKKVAESKEEGSDGRKGNVSAAGAPEMDSVAGESNIDTDSGHGDDRGSAEGDKSEHGPADLGLVSMGSASREVSMEPSNGSVGSVELKCGEFGLESSKSTEPGVESREMSSERSVSREVSLERGQSREVSFEQSKSDHSLGSKGSSKSREVSGDRSIHGSASPDATSSKECGDNAMETDTSISAVDAKLQETSSLLVDLQSRQNERLSQPPYTSSSSSHLMIQPPTQEEVGVAREIRQTLASLTAMVDPEDIVSVDALHNAMDVSTSPLQSDLSPMDTADPVAPSDASSGTKPPSRLSPNSVQVSPHSSA